MTPLGLPIHAEISMDRLAVWQLHPGSDVVSRLRGRAAYERMMSLGAVGLVSDTVTTGDYRALSRVDRLQVQLITPATKHALRFMIDLRRRIDATFLVDVTFPLGHGYAYTGILSRDDPLVELDDDASRSFWTNPENTQWLVKAIEAADAVSVPYQEWVDGIRELNDRWFVIPDLTDPTDPDQVSRFASDLDLAHNRGRS